MSAAARAISANGLKRRALSLGAVKACDQLMQFLLPVVLVRSLDTATFGEYRLLWLAIGTVMGLAPLAMPAAMFYFLPRSDAATRRLYIHQTLLFLFATGLLGALALSPLDPWLPRTLAPLERHGALVPAFVVLWVAATLLDYLPTVEERIRLQAVATISVSALRALLLGAGAWLTGDLTVILWLLLAVAVLKIAFLFGYVERFHGWGRPWLRRASFSGQLRYAAPFGLSAAFYTLRGQADQWVAASLFALQSFAAFSVASVVGQMVNLCRASVVEAFFPSMSRLEAAGDLPSAMEMNARANEMVGWALYPLLAFVFVFAPDIVSLIYTHAYADAAPVMRVYIVGLIVLVVELSSLLQLMRQGLYNLALNAAMLCASLAVSWTAGVHLGLAGAAAGSVSALYLDRLVTLRRIARLTGVPVRRQQRWASLARLLACAVLAAAVAGGVVRLLLTDEPRLVRLLVGGLMLGIVYLSATYRRYIAPALQ